MMRKLLISLLVIAILFVATPALAQDAIEIQNDGVVGIEKDVFIGLCIAIAIIIQGVFIAYMTKNPKILYESYLKLLEDKEVRGAAEMAYMTSSLPVQEFIKILKAGVLVVDSLDIVGVDDYVDPLADFMGDITGDDPEDDDTILDI